MQPEIPSTMQGGEREPARIEQIPSVERAPDGAERGVERAPERQEQHSEAAARASELARQVPTTSAVPTPVAAPTLVQTKPDDDLPATAADEDLIEKEWVDQAKKIIRATQDDPAAREREIARLQFDYRMKRYGKELGSS